MHTQPHNAVLNNKRLSMSFLLVTFAGTKSQEERIVESFNLGLSCIRCGRNESEPATCLSNATILTRKKGTLKYITFTCLLFLMAKYT